jgi:hypothetical protein
LQEISSRVADHKLEVLEFTTEATEYTEEQTFFTLGPSCTLW